MSREDSHSGSIPYSAEVGAENVKQHNEPPQNDAASDRKPHEYEYEKTCSERLAARAE